MEKTNQGRICLDMNAKDSYDIKLHKEKMSTEKKHMTTASYLRLQLLPIISIYKAKAVPPHAIKRLGGRGDIAPTHSRPQH
jgi:hypothetical protein